MLGALPAGTSGKGFSFETNTSVSFRRSKGFTAGRAVSRPWPCRLALPLSARPEQCSPARPSHRPAVTASAVPSNGSSAGDDTENGSQPQERRRNNEDSQNGAHATQSSDRAPHLLGSLDGDMSENTFPRQRFDGQGNHPLEKLRNQVQLSTYGNSIGENLKDLQSFMKTHLEGCISGLHLLPLYPSSGDGGFAPLTYQEIDPKFGDWEDVKALGREYDLCMEFMLNHISPKSKQFQDYLEKGDESEYADMFVDWTKFWQGEPTQEQLKLIRTRKPEAPVLEVTLNDGTKKKLWCTFGPQQIDINPFSQKGREFVLESLRSLGTQGAKLIRLDAFGYVTKKPGTRCFFEEPEVWDLLKDLDEAAQEHDTGLLCEVHEEYETNIKLAHAGYVVYDFALPLLILHAFTFQTARNLNNWLRLCPRRQITVLDTHDGMGIDDIAGLATVCDINELESVIDDRLGCSPNWKYFYDPKTREYSGSPHQYNCTYFSAVNGNPRSYLLARAIQFFTPGIPMVYYVGLLAGLNDFEAVEAESGNVRAINRHRYTLEEAEAALEVPVVKALLDMCRFRNRHKAFLGEVTVVDGEVDHILTVTWQNGPHKATLTADLTDQSFDVVATRGSNPDELQTIRYQLNEAEETAAERRALEVNWKTEEICAPPAL
ncbi:hypothetical protein WJX72_003171 [[Myrmecia] bisecta]|uniref:Glycosyl hydrolase family 13 catalytic domain-containing protein n=1 Tax=[Myrmecia] bisecta TaxID=41462 RepID=A0AAW1Q160_9CHLO